MIWGEFQSVIQLATAINIAYYALPELREPYRKKISDDAAEILRAMPYAQLGAESVRNRIGLIEELLPERLVKERELVLQWYDRIQMPRWYEVNQQVAGFWLFFVSLAGVLLLVLSSFEYKLVIYDWTAAAIIAVGYLPVLILSGINICAAIRLKGAGIAVAEFRRKLMFLSIEAIDATDPSRSSWR